MVKLELSESYETRPMLLHEVLKMAPMEVDFLWGKFIPSTGLSGIIAESGLGKSTFALELCIAICSDKDMFLGFPLKPNRKSALYISTEENLKNIGARLNKFESLNIEVKSIEKILLYIKQGAGADIVKSLEASLQSGGVDIIVFDALGDLIKGDPNNMVVVRELLSKLQAVADQLECVVFLVHHTRKNTQGPLSKSEGLGSTATDNKVRALLGLQKTHIPGQVGLRLLKTNYADAKVMNQLILLENSEKGLAAIDILSSQEQAVKAKFESITIVKNILKESLEDGEEITLDEMLELAKEQGYSFGRTKLSQDIKEAKAILHNESKPLFSIDATTKSEKPSRRVRSNNT